MYLYQRARKPESIKLYFPVTHTGYTYQSRESSYKLPSVWSLRSKTSQAQVNEALCKVLCHNLCCLIQSMYELGIEPTFWEQAA